MHGEIVTWVSSNAPLDARKVLDVCGRSVNGSLRDLFDQAETYRVLDLRPEPDVDIVADARDWVPDQLYDLVLCCGSFEHIQEWRKVFATCHKACKPGGIVVLTMAGPAFQPHSAHGGSVQEGEFYQSIQPQELIEASLDLEWISTRVEENQARGDLYFWGQKR